MDATRFWSIVEQSHDDAPDDPYAQAEALGVLLEGLSTEELIGFQEQLIAAHLRLYTWEQVAATDLLYGSLGDDGFTDYRSWVISLGQETFEAIAADPNALADVETIGDGAAGIGEFFGSVASTVYYDLTGNYFSDDGIEIVEFPGEEITGRKLTAEEALEAFPRLAGTTPT